jgi:hypothetical protein
MVQFQVSLSKSAQGDILVNGMYVSGNDPIVVERVVLKEFDAGGNVVGTSTHRTDTTIDPMQGSTLLVTKPPFGSNVKTARATAHYFVVDKEAQSGTLNL